MTKEERRIEFYGKDDARAYDHDELYLMSEHSKEVAIGFHDWRKNRYQETHIGYYEPKVGTDEFKVYNYTIEQLFNQYINQLKKP
jgi:hypothetical protein